MNLGSIAEEDSKEMKSFDDRKEEKKMGSNGERESEYFNRAKQMYGAAETRKVGSLHRPWRANMALKTLGNPRNANGGRKSCQSARIRSSKRESAQRPISCVGRTSLEVINERNEAPSNPLGISSTSSKDVKRNRTPLKRGRAGARRTDFPDRTGANVSTPLTRPKSSTSPPNFASRGIDSKVETKSTVPAPPENGNHYEIDPEEEMSELSEYSEESVPISDPENMLAKQRMDLSNKYACVEYLGHGSYGHVYGAVDIHTGEKVAIKKISGVFDDVMHAKRLLRELRILRVLQHDHIIQLKNILPPEDINNFNELYIVFEFADTDLQKLITSNQHFTDLHIQFFLHQILVSLKYVHSKNIIHRDLKPANILINANCSLMLCDFGLARGTNQSTRRNVTVGGRYQSKSPERMSVCSTGSRSRKRKGAPTVVSIPQASATVPSQLTKHVVTRWYRAPELILLQSNYTSAIDMWSVGCVLSELLTMLQGSVDNPKDRKPLFPGKSCFPLSADHHLAYKDRKDQLAVIFDVIGTPTADDIKSISTGKARRYLSSLHKKPPKEFKELFPDADEKVLDLLKKLLCFDPRKRITASEALEHPYLKNVREASEERELPSAPIFFEFEDAPITKSMIKDLIVKEVLCYNRHLVSDLVSSNSNYHPTKRSRV